MNERLFLVTYVSDQKPKESYINMVDEMARVLDLLSFYINKAEGHFEIVESPDEFKEFDLSQYNKKGDLK